MGVKTKVAEVILKDFSGAALSYFGNARVPASIIAGSSLGALFALSKFGSSDDRTPIERFLIKMYRLVSWSSFVLALNAVITCTVASTSILHGRFDPMAETAYMLLKREFEYEFVSARWSYSISLLLFIAIVTVRLLLEFDLLKDPARTDSAKFVVLSAVALTAQLLSYINPTLYCWPNLAEMTIHLLRLIVNKASEEPSFMRLLAIVSAMGAMFFGFKSASAGNKNVPQKDKEE
jgi:hypothetical protein